MSLFSWLRRRLHLDEDDFADELRSHLEIAAQDHRSRGADARDAEFASRKDFGNLTLATEEARRVWQPRWLEWLLDAAGDVHFALRSLAKNPGFVVTVIAVLTLGIGVNATVFTMLKGMALSPLAGVDRAADLVVVTGESSSGREMRVSYPDYVELRRQTRGFSSVIATLVANATLGRGRAARQIFAELVSGNYFDVTGVAAQRGRMFQLSDESASGRHPYVVLSDGLWRREYQADPAIIGRIIEVNNFPLTVIGVADARFHGTVTSYDVEAFIPVTMAPQLGFTFGRTDLLNDVNAGFLYPHARLRPGVSLAEVNAEIGAWWKMRALDRPVAEAARQVKVVPFWRSPYGGQTYIVPLLVLLCIMGMLVLLIACANIAGLILVRGVTRRGEIAVRLALGASRARLVRLLVVENLVLALPGAILGVTLALATVPRMVAYAEWLAAPERLYFNIDVDAWVLGYAVFAAALSALTFGLVPALRATRVDLVATINEDASTRNAGRGRMRKALVVAQVAVSLALLVGAGLVARTLDHARRANPGFDRQHGIVVSLDLKQNAYDEPRGRVFYRKLLDAARAHPGVEAASLAGQTPLTFLDTRVQRVTIDGYQPGRRDEDLAFMQNVVGPDYFRTLGVPVLAGRAFDDRDDPKAAPALMVNRTFAERFWGSAENAIGRRVRIAGGDWRQIIGVAADLKYSRVNEPARGYLYLPFFQAYRSGMIVHLRGAITPDQARALIASLDGELPVHSARPLADATRGALVFFELAAAMLSVFGLAGLALAALGTYGLVSYSVKQSAREIGIRMALGATAAAVVCTFLGRGLRLGLLGAGFGVAAALAAARLLTGFLFGVSATDFGSYALALAAVIGGVLLATLIPAWRASRTNPVSALRQQ